MVDHNDWSRWFAISSSHVYAVPVIGEVGKTKTAKLRHLILLSKVNMLSAGGDALRGCSAATTGDLGSA